eukprot:755982-Hanusia_phi.AAC.1
MAKLRGLKFLSLCLVITLIALSKHAIADSLDQSEDQDETGAEHGDAAESVSTKSPRTLLDDDDKLKEKIREAFASNKESQNLPPSPDGVHRESESAQQPASGTDSASQEKPTSANPVSGDQVQKSSQDSVPEGYGLSVHDSSSICPNHQITVSWIAPANRHENDFLAIFAKGSNSYSLKQELGTPGQREGTVTFRGAETTANLLVPGSYEIRYIDSATQQARQVKEFVVQSCAGGDSATRGAPSSTTQTMNLGQASSAESSNKLSIASGQSGQSLPQNVPIQSDSQATAALSGNIQQSGVQATSG